MSKIILLMGPTAVGKTALSIKLAKHYNAEIINADSRYFYKEPLIATAKVTKEEMEGIIHHMIDIISLNDDYSIYEYQKDARKVLDKLLKENKNVIITGGSGLYIKALLYDYKLEDKTIKDADYSSYTNEELKEMLDKIDKDNNVHVNNRKRLERYLNNYNNSGKIINKGSKKKYEFFSICLIADRDVIYKRINERADIMFENGLLEEANRLKEYKNFNAVIGYKEFTPYYNNECSIEEVKEKIKQDTRRYAKRQITWFKTQMKGSNYIKVNYDNINETLDKIIDLIGE